MKRLFAVGIVASLALCPVVSEAAGFKDISSDHWAKPTIEWAVQSDLVKGYPDGTFKPTNLVNEAEFLTMFLRSYKDRQEMIDFDQKPWPVSYYDYAQSMHYEVSETPDLGKKSMINRQEVADIIAASQGTTYQGREAVHFLLLHGLAKGKGNKSTINSFDAKGYLTRAEAVAFVKNVLEKGNQMIQPTPLIPSPPLPVVGDDEEIKPITPNPNVTPTPKPTEVKQDNRFLLEADPVTQPTVEAFVKNLEIVGNKVKGIVPQIPENHTILFKYKDISDGKWGVRSNDKNFSSLKEGDKFEVNYVGEGGFLIFSLFKNGYEGKNDVRVEIPSLQVEWGAKR